MTDSSSSRSTRAIFPGERKGKITLRSMAASESMPMTAAEPPNPWDKSRSRAARPLSAGAAMRESPEDRTNNSSNNPKKAKASL